MFARSLVLAAVLVAAAPATSATIADLYNTGVDNAGVALTGNVADLHYSFAGGTAYTGGTNGNFPIGPWISDTSTTRWITPTTNAADGVNSGVYSTTFDLTGYSLLGASISGVFAADDAATVFLNGVQISGTNVGGFTFTTPFSANSGFVAGINTLSFAVLNSGGGPSGVNVSVSGVAFVPEPATWGLMIAGFGMVGYAARRRRTAVTA